MVTRNGFFYPILRQIMDSSCSPGPVAQTVVGLTADPWVVSLISRLSSALKQKSREKSRVKNLEKVVKK